MAYSDKVMEHYENPRNVGSFNPTNNNIGTGLVGAPIKQKYGLTKELDNHLGIA